MDDKDITRSNGGEGDAPLEHTLRLLGLPGAIDAAAYLVGANAAQYRLLVGTIAREQTRRLTGVAHDELPALVAAQLRETARTPVPDDLVAEVIDAEVLTRRMDQLVTWGTCLAWQDQARTEADFLRNRARYQLTEVGAAIQALTGELDHDDGQATAAVLSPPILAGALEAVVRDAEFAPAEASAAFAQVQTTIADMARTANRWQGRLAAALGGAPDEEKVAKVLGTVVDYVDMWGSGVDVFSDRIIAVTEAMAPWDRETWRSLAFVRLGGGAEEARVEQVIGELRATIETVRRWFGGPDALARRLRLQIRDAVAPLLRSHRTLLAVGGAISRSTDLLQLARALEAAPSHDEAWRLWATATGLYGARHLGLPSPEVHPQPSMSIWDAPPVPLERRLRTQGPRALAGRAPRVRDTSVARALARQEASRRRAHVAEAEAALTARSGTALSTWDPLSAQEAELLLELIALARARPPENGTYRATSPDGRRTLRLTPLVPPSSAVLHVPEGRLSLADAMVELST